METFNLLELLIDEGLNGIPRVFQMLMNIAMKTECELVFRAVFYDGQSIFEYMSI